jgi:hypothetical protein
VTGRGDWDRARLAAQRKTAAAAARDPQSAVTGGPGAVARVRAMMRPCRTPLPAEPPGGTCGHTGYEHDLGGKDGKETRTRCLTGTAAGYCPCTAYTPEDP